MSEIFEELKKEEVDLEKIKKFKNINVLKNEYNEYSPIHYACNPKYNTKNRYKLIDYLLRKGAKIDIPDQLGHTAFHYQIMNLDDPEITKKFLNRYADFTLVDKRKNNIFHLAKPFNFVYLYSYFRKNEKLLKKLLDPKFVENKSILEQVLVQKNELKQTPFENKNFNIECISIYSIKKEDKKRKWIFNLCATSKLKTDDEYIKIQKNYYLSLQKIKKFKIGKTKEEQEKIDKIIKDKKTDNKKLKEIYKEKNIFDTNYFDLKINRKTLLSYAFEVTDEFFFKALPELSIGLPEDEQNYLKYTIKNLELTKAFLKEDIEKELLTKKFDDGSTVFLLACRYQNDLELIKSILKIDPNIIKDKDLNDNNCLHIALKYKNLNLIKHLIEIDDGRDLITKENKKKMTPQLYTCKYISDEEIIKSILEKSEKFDKIDENDNTLLHLLILKRRKLSINYLFIEEEEYFKELCLKKNKKNVYPFHLAAKHLENYLSLEIIKKTGDLIIEVDSEGNTVFHYAYKGSLRRNNDELLIYLLDNYKELSGKRNKKHKNIYELLDHTTLNRIQMRLFFK